MARKTFVDSSGFYALLVKNDSMHRRARQLLKSAASKKVQFVTTDYVIEETATLLRAQRHAGRLQGFFQTVMESDVCVIEWMDPCRFVQTQELFMKHGDHEWSFTDCFSFLLMRQLDIRDALTKDRHFQQAGFNPLLG